MHQLKSVLGLLVLLLLQPRGPLLAATPLVERPKPVSKGVLVPLFQSQEVLEIVIEGPLGTLLIDRKKDRRRERDATLTFVELDGRQKTVPLVIRLAGRSRSDLVNCNSMPMDLTLAAQSVSGKLLDSQGLLRFTKHCRDNDLYEQFVLEEHLIFRILNLFTELSYRSRLLKVRYIDTTFGDPDVVRYAFFIEHENLMSARNGWRKLKRDKVSRQEIEPNQTALLGVFQYLIGNTDWSVLGGDRGRCCHNTQLIGASGGSTIPVPYDFDNAGIIAVPYAKPDKIMGLSNVRSRLYRGFCNHNRYLPAVFERFRSQRKAIYALYENQVGLSPGRKKLAFEYLNAFYRTINTPELRQAAFEDACR